MSAEPAMRDEWVRWVADSLVAGHSVDDVIARLAEHGLSPDRARAEVDAIARSPLLAMLQERASRTTDDAMIHRLVRQRLSRGPGVVERRPDLDAASFYATYVAHGVPVVLPGFCNSWPAMNAWTPEALRDRVGAVEVRVCTGRAGDPRADRDFRVHERSMPLSEYLDLLPKPGADVYMVANSRNLDGPLSALLDDLAPPPGWVDRWRLRGGASLWLGPAGTHTTTHHDSSSILFCQLVGRKVLWLASPSETRLCGTEDAFYAAAQLSDRVARSAGGALEGATIFEVELMPGDALLLPVGWWHEVASLDISVSCSITALRVPNRYDDYHPGLATRPKRVARAER